MANRPFAVLTLYSITLVQQLSRKLFKMKKYLSEAPDTISMENLLEIMHGYFENIKVLEIKKMYTLYVMSYIG